MLTNNLEIHKWKELSLHLKRIKEEEADLRRDICADLLENDEMHNGRSTHKERIDGYDVVATQTLSYNLDLAVLATIWDELSPEELECIKLKPTLVIGPYKKLPEDSLLHEAIITKFAMPTLKADEVEIA